MEAGEARDDEVIRWPRKGANGYSVGMQMVRCCEEKTELSGISRDLYIQAMTVSWDKRGRELGSRGWVRSTICRGPDRNDGEKRTQQLVQKGTGSRTRKSGYD